MEKWEENEGRRLFNLCVKHGARPGNVHQWLKEKLERIQYLENVASNAAWDADNRRLEDAARNSESWK